ncbi:MAG: hypothetical protein GY862_05515 [Gammaproteobacteria bacterium]|nr:hypothetical protein [Gammaproteobacteria bacterium]
MAKKTTKPKSNKERRIEENEAKIDEYLLNEGRNIRKNPLEGIEGAGRQGDRIIDGIKTEYKTLESGATSTTVKNVINNSIRKGGQARQVIFDARGSGLTKEQALEGIKRAMGISRGRIDEIRVIGNGFDVSN